MDESSTSIKPSGATLGDVPAHVFESFLQALEASGVSAGSLPVFARRSWWIRSLPIETGLRPYFPHRWHRRAK